jgi:hypothetical protein
MEKESHHPSDQELTCLYAGLTAVGFATANILIGLMAPLTLPWAQEVWSSNLHAPTESFSIAKLLKPNFALLHCGATWER